MNMNNDMLRKAYDAIKTDMNMLVLELCKYGVEMDDFITENPDDYPTIIKLYYHVPSHSYLRDENDIEMAGNHLIQFAKNKVNNFITEKFGSFILKLKFYAKIVDYYWTKEDEIRNNTNILALITNSYINPDDEFEGY